MKTSIMILILLLAVTNSFSCSEFENNIENNGKVVVVPNMFSAWDVNSECRTLGLEGEQCDRWYLIPENTKLTIIRPVSLDPRYLYTTDLGFFSVEAYEVVSTFKHRHYIPDSYIHRLLKDQQ